MKEEREKVTLENQGTGGEGASGDGEAPPRAQQALESKSLLGKPWDDSLQSPQRKQSAINGRPSGSSGRLLRRSTVRVEAVARRESQKFRSLCLQLSTAISAGGRPSEAIGRPLSGQRSTASKRLQVIHKMLQMFQMTQENRKVTQQNKNIQV